MRGLHFSEEKGRGVDEGEVGSKGWEKRREEEETVIGLEKIIN